MVTNDSITEKLHSTTDAMVWAKEFCRILRENDIRLEDIDEGWMVGWFANAMVTQEAETRREDTDRGELRETLISIATARQEADDWDYPDFDWKMLARKMEDIARKKLSEIA
jgi:hypothetical protein